MAEDIVDPPYSQRELLLGKILSNARGMRGRREFPGIEHDGDFIDANSLRLARKALPDLEGLIREIVTEIQSEEQGTLPTMGG